MTLAELFAQGDPVSKVVVLLLLAMSVASWVVILWKSWLLQRASADLSRAIAAFWQSGALEDATPRVLAFDRERVLAPLLAALGPRLDGALEPRGTGLDSTLGGQGSASAQLTRLLRDALHSVLNRLQFGQVLLATVGSTAPFVGLLGTVWGIYHALISISGTGQISIDKVAGPVGEALIMTAAGLAVAIPAVLAYNILGRSIGRIEADLEGFARDLRELLLTRQAPAAGHDAAQPVDPGLPPAPQPGTASASGGGA